MSATPLSSNAETENLLTSHQKVQARLNEESFERSVDGYQKDPFKPLDNLSDDNENILTFRAIAVGVFCGSLVNASNIYLGLKSGWTSSANLFASIVGFALLKSCPEFLKHLPFLAGDFGPRENNIVQTAATAAGGMSIVYISTFPAMYQLGLMTSPGEDFWRLVSLTAAGGFFGLFCATPLRRFFIILVARDLRLVFPTPSATAITIRNMHQAVGGGDSSIPKRKMKVLCFAFAFAIMHRVLSPFAPGVLWDWHPFTWYHAFAPSDVVALGFESWGWYLEWTPAFIGTGMLVGTNVAVYHFVGALLAWGIIGPLLVSYGVAYGTKVNDTGLASYITISDEFSSSSHPSARYWLLWPGIACMVAVSLTELACQWRIFWYSMKLIWSNCLKLVSLFFPSSRNRREFLSEKVGDPNAIEDPALPEDQIRTWMWLPGLLVTIILACGVMKLQYNMPVRETCIALFMAFLFSFLAVQSTGATDITPLAAGATSSQVILGADTSAQGWALEKAQRLSLLGGAISAMGASQASDLTGDFRVGFLLRTSPKKQLAAQLIGTVFSSFIAPGIYALFVSAYPCINDAYTNQCPFQVPSASAWRAIAIASTDPASSIPSSSMAFSLIMASTGSFSVLVRHFLWTGRWSWMRAYHPSMMVVSLAFIIPATIYATAMLIGAVFAWYWMKVSPRTFEMFGFVVAAGWIAGEGIGGVINAALQIVGLSGEKFGTTIGCPDGVC